MQVERKYLAPLVIALAAGVAAFLILSMEKPKAAYPHGHGHEEEGHGRDHGEGKKEEPGHEGHGQRIELDEESFRNSGITLDTVRARTIRKSLPLSGLVQPNQDKMARMMPRFAGVVREVRVHLGNKVAKGQTLAIIESNESLAPYPLISQVSGTIVQKDVTPGQVVSESDVLFTVADLGTVWIDLSVHRQDFGRLRTGQEVLVEMDKESPPIRSRLSYLSPIGAENTQTMLARIVVPNPDGHWRPGLYVDGRITLSTQEVPMAVSEEAIQTVDGKEVVFVKEGHAFEAREARFGARDGEWAEVVSGVAAGDAYCSGNSFVLKAELGKGEAKHEH